MGWKLQEEGLPEKANGIIEMENVGGLTVFGQHAEREVDGSLSSVLMEIVRLWRFSQWRHLPLNKTLTEVPTALARP